MQRILIPVDGSEYALRAVQYASAIVKGGIAAELHLLNVQEHLDGRVQAFLSLEKIKAIEAKEADRILQPARQILDDGRIPYIASMRIGRVAKSIVDYVQDEKCDGIIMGTHGRGVLGNLILGSVMNKVIHLVHVPVTLIR
jgi:nucleotide-binding universal stress UspA family protein